MGMEHVDDGDINSQKWVVQDMDVRQKLFTVRLRCSGKQLTVLGLTF
jgi:hypothetical protein